MKSCKLLKAKQSVVLWQVFSPMCISGFYSSFSKSTGNDLPQYSEEKQTLLWHLRGVSRMKNQGLLLTMPSKPKCVVTQFSKAMENHPGCCILSAKLRGIVLPGKMPGRLQCLES